MTYENDTTLKTTTNGVDDLTFEDYCLFIKYSTILDDLSGISNKQYAEYLSIRDRIRLASKTIICKI